MALPALFWPFLQIRMRLIWNYQTVSMRTSSMELPLVSICPLPPYKWSNNYKNVGVGDTLSSYYTGVCPTRLQHRQAYSRLPRIRNNRQEFHNPGRRFGVGQAQHPVAANRGTSRGL